MTPASHTAARAATANRYDGTAAPRSSTRRLPAGLAWRDAFAFPVSTPEARRDVLVGGLAVIFLLPVGWILNLGARLDVVQRLYEGDAPYFRGFRPWTRTFRRGCISAATIFSYLSPFLLLAALAAAAWWRSWGVPAVTTLAVLAAAAFVLGVFTLPGCMTVYACEGDARVLRRPRAAFRRAMAHRRVYLRAWGISLAAVSLSFLGLLALGVGFVFTSVWSWEVVGYAFTVAMYSEERGR